MDLAAMLVYGVLGLIVLMALGALFAPVRWGARLLVNGCFGVLGLIITGVFGSFAGLILTNNFFRVAHAWLRGTPGLGFVVLLIVLLNPKKNTPGGGIRTFLFR